MTLWSSDFMRFERVFYEARPILFLVMGAIAFFNANGSKILLVCGFVLLFCATLVLSLRSANRNFEKLIYDVRPYAYLAGAGLTLYYYNDSRIAVASALLLMFCATLILRWRTRK